MPAKKKGAARARNTAEPRATATKTNVRLHCSNEAWMTARQALSLSPSSGVVSFGIMLEAIMAVAVKNGTLFMDCGVPLRRATAWPAPMVHEPIPVDAALLARFTRAFGAPLGLTQGQALASAVHWYAAHCLPLAAPAAPAFDDDDDDDDAAEAWKGGAK